ncbi:MAG: TonB-system energizer ExbB [Arcobacteraceae bacterium]|jgi:biopolymer transport protein ExbB|nr:TonB-system energizer ExbB [Arcobacteraceae bacterium]
MNIELMKMAVDYGILLLLLTMGFIALFLYVERLLFYKHLDISKYEKKQILEIELTNNTSVIASIASNSVYIGLLGTVLGILITFYEMGQTGQIDVKIIMTSLAFALKATALGLVVAIPAMMFYNHLVRKIEVHLSLFEAK